MAVVEPPTTMSHHQHHVAATATGDPEPDDEELNSATTPVSTPMCTCISARRMFCACAVFATHIGTIRSGTGCPWLCPWARAASACTTSTKLLPGEKKSKVHSSIESQTPPSDSPPPVVRCCGGGGGTSCCSGSSRRRRSTDQGVEIEEDLDNYKEEEGIPVDESGQGHYQDLEEGHYQGEGHILYHDDIQYQGEYQEGSSYYQKENQNYYQEECPYEDNAQNYFPDTYYLKDGIVNKYYTHYKSADGYDSSTSIEYIEY